MERVHRFDWETAREMHRDGDTIPDLARFFGVSTPAIVNALARLDYADTGVWSGPPSMTPRASRPREPKDPPAEPEPARVVELRPRVATYATAYALCRRLAQMLDALARDDDPDVRARASDALDHAYAIEDRLAREHGRPAERASR